MTTGRRSLGWFLLVLVPVVALNAQIQVRLHRPPPNRLTLADLWWVDLTNSSTNTYNVYLHAEVREAARGLAAEANSGEFALAPGLRRIRPADITEVRDAKYYGDFEASLIRTGQFPAGDYTICVSVIEVRTRRELGRDCIRHEVKPIGPPTLVAPADGATLTERTPLFRWLPGAPVSPDARYHVRIVEILPGQTREDAIRANPPVLAERGLPSTQFRYPVQGRALEPGKRYAWWVEVSLGEGSDVRASEIRELAIGVARVPVATKVACLSVEREVERHGTWYEVTICLANTCAEDVTNIALTDSSIGFQAVDDARAMRPYPPSMHIPADDHAIPCSVRYQPGSHSSVIEMSPGTSSAAELQTLPPGRQLVIHYSAVPFLYTLFSMTGTPTYEYAVGKRLKITYTTGGESRTFTRAQGETPADLNTAFASADYLLVTTPAKLFDLNDAPAVDELLTTAARLARAKTGVLGYLDAWAACHTMVRGLIKPGAFWSSKLAPSWAQSGYLLLVGEKEIIPHWPTVTVVTDRPIDFSDYYYAHTSGDWHPELAVGRIVGATAADLTVPIENSLKVYYHSNAAYDGSDALIVTGCEKPPPESSSADNFTPDAEIGADYLRSSKGMTALVYGQEFTLTKKLILTKALYRKGAASGGADVNSDLSGFTLNQLAAWLLEITIGLPAPAPGDSPFTDSEGHARRVPAGFQSDDLDDAVGQAEAIENGKRPGYEHSYVYTNTPGTDGNIVAGALGSKLPEHDVALFSAHGNYGSFNHLTASKVDGMDLTTAGIRPVIVSFACWNGEYERNGADGLARAFLRRGAAAFAGYTEMTNTGWFGTQVGQHGFTQFWAKNKRIGKIVREWKSYLADLTCNTCTGSASHSCRMLFGTNLYGDPKFGGD